MLGACSLSRQLSSGVAIKGTVINASAAARLPILVNLTSVERVGSLFECYIMIARHRDDYWLSRDTMKVGQ